MQRIYSAPPPLFVNHPVETPELKNLHQWEINLPRHLGKFSIADTLIRAGQKLPSLSIPEKKFSRRSDFFKHLSVNCKDLFIYVRTNPTLINEQDENGMALLHHAASIGFTVGANVPPLILPLLADESNIDFNLTDNDGNTAVHIAALRCRDKLTCHSIFPYLVQRAIEKGFDCRKKSADGYTILHLAALFTHKGWRTDAYKNVSQILNIITENPIPYLIKVLNMLSSSGVTALYCCIERESLDEARALVEAGANPSLGKKGQRPIDCINERIAVHRVNIEKLNLDTSLREPYLTSISEQKVAQITYAHKKITELIYFKKYLMSRLTFAT